MADEKKTYLVNVESNLNEYAKEAAKAKEEVDKLKLANMLMSEDTPREEVEKNNAALKVAEKRYRDAQKEVQVFTAATKSETGSRKQLGEVLSLQQKALGKLGNAYVKDADGIMKLNPLYVEQTKKIKATKDAIIEYDKAQSDGRSSVGLYTEALEGLPGPLGAATNSIKMLGAQLKLLLLNPVVLVVSAIVGAFVLLYKAFKKSQENSIVLNKAIGGLKGIFETLLNVLKPVAEFVVNKLVKGFEILGKVADKTIGIVSKGLRFLGFDKAADSVNNWVETIKEGAKAGSDLAEAEIRLRNAQREAELIRFKYLKQEEKLRQIRDDEALSIDERIKANEELGKVLMEQSEAELKIANMALKVANDRIRLEGETEDNLDKRAEALTKVADIEEAITGFQSEQMVNINSLQREAKALAKAAQDILDKGIAAQKKLNAERRKEIEKAGVDKMKELAAQYQKEQEAALLNQENELQLKELHNENIFKIQRERLQVQYEAEIKAANKIGADVSIIDEKYAAYRTEIAQAEADNKLSLYRGFAGNIATIFGESTAIGKVAAIAAATIDTYAAATKALAAYPPPFSYVAAGAAIAAGLANVKKIISVKSGLPGDSSRGLTSISSSPAAQRAFASQVAPSFVTQPQLTQTQLNASQQGNLLTAADIAAAFSKMPAPIVTVEDINARIASKNKVEVRANI